MIVAECSHLIDRYSKNIGDILTKHGISSLIGGLNLELIDFELAMSSHIRVYNQNNLPKVCEALHIELKNLLNNNRKFHLITFVQGEINKEQVENKVLNSLLLLIDKLDDNVEFSRHQVHLDIVYDPSENDKTPSLTELGQSILDAGNSSFANFGFDKLKTVYFKSVNTFTYDDFYVKSVSMLFR